MEYNSANIDFSFSAILKELEYFIMSGISQTQKE